LLLTFLFSPFILILIPKCTYTVLSKNVVTKMYLDGFPKCTYTVFKNEYSQIKNNVLDARFLRTNVLNSRTMYLKLLIKMLWNKLNLTFPISLILRTVIPKCTYTDLRTNVARFLREQILKSRTMYFSQFKNNVLKYFLPLYMVYAICSFIF